MICRMQRMFFSATPKQASYFTAASYARLERTTRRRILALTSRENARGRPHLVTTKVRSKVHTAKVADLLP